MARRTVDPSLVKTMRDWVSRWPKTGNLDFDAETREPTIYTPDKARTRVGSIPWKREGDTLTILAQPTRFSESAVKAATSRYTRFRDQRAQYATAGEEQLRAAESAVLQAWRDYYAAVPSSRPMLMREVLTAERTMREMEEAIAKQTKRGRVVVEVAVGSGSAVAAAVPPMPLNRRGIPIGDAATA
jgi:hypothetical protein